MTDCPCQSGNSLTDCCGPYLDNGIKPDNAEALMRARYTAHTRADIGFIIGTHHPSNRSEIDEASTKKWAAQSTWLGLDIKNVEGGEPSDRRARIEFVAKYRDQNRRRHDHTEIAIFEKHNGDWFFKDAEMPKVEQFQREVPKQGRNDPCACGSGKKYKKCCGAA